MVLYSVLICALLVVQCDSYLVDTPRNVVVMTGASVTLPCKTSGGQNITWLAQDGSVISKGTTTTMPSKYSVDNSESGRYNLVIKHATFGLGGTYRCQQTDDANIRYYAEVTVLDGTPRITSNGPDGNNMLLSETMELTCSIPCQGNMFPTIVWSPADGNCVCSMRTAFLSTSTSAQSSLNISYSSAPPSYMQRPSFSCLVFFDRVNVTDSVRARNAPSYTPVQLSYTVNVQVPVFGASLSASLFGSDGIMYTGSSIECQGSGNMLNYYGYDIVPAPTYTWQVSTISTDLQFGPMSSRYLTATQDMIGRTTFTCTASNTIRGVTYSATSDPLTVLIMKDANIGDTTTMSPTSDSFTTAYYSSSKTSAQTRGTTQTRVPVARATLTAYDSPLRTGSSVECRGSYEDYSYYSEDISPAPTYSWQVSTTSTDLHFGPNSDGYLTITRDMIGATTFTCTASNTIRGVTYSATSDPMTAVVVASSSKMSAQAQVTFVAAALSAMIISLRL